ncbi:MAG: GNAT family N-acetyltransferase, partial [Planctomycetes bacterium]|nr:GNAT family N-acetyltransferase [Planctomycetota bacterium]
AGLDLITTTFQSCDRPLERELVHVGQLLDRLGFRSFDVCVLECTPASLLSGAEPPFPAGYRHRPLLSADIPACAELMSASPDLLMEEVRYPAPECEEILRASAGPSGHFSGDLAGVALAPDGRVAGFATANSTGVIGQLYVRAPHRGLGIGRALLDRTLRAIARRGIERAILTAIHGNTAALALYGRAGFAEIYRYPLFFRYLKR